MSSGTITPQHDCTVVLTASFEAETQTTGGGSTGAAWDTPSMGAYSLYWYEVANPANNGQSPQYTMAGPRVRYAVEWQFEADAGVAITVQIARSVGLGYKIICNNLELQAELIYR